MGDRCACASSDGAFCADAIHRTRFDADGEYQYLGDCPSDHPCECGRCRDNACGNTGTLFCGPTDQCCWIWDYYFDGTHTCCPAGTECCNLGQCCGAGEHCQEFADHYNLSFCIRDDEKLCRPEYVTLADICTYPNTCKLSESCSLATETCDHRCCTAGEKSCDSLWQATCCKLGDVCCGDGCCPKGTECCGASPPCCVDKAIGCQAEDYWSHCQSGYGYE